MAKDTIGLQPFGIIVNKTAITVLLAESMLLFFVKLVQIVLLQFYNFYIIKSRESIQFMPTRLEILKFIYICKRKLA
jgi:hypothetical protein